MSLARAFEAAQALLWEEGHISGEMHLGTGEEALAAVLTSHLRDGDAVALDHRPTPILAMLGVDLEAMLLEVMGDPQGLCGGFGGHMHLFSRDHLAASSGIVGAAGPMACGFGLAARRLRPGHVAVAFFGDGAVNQGMLLESFNLAVAWALPVLFVCKDNGWAITTRSCKVTGGSLVARARAFGIESNEVDGTDLVALQNEVERAFDHLRSARGPYFLRAEVPRLDGHFLGDPLVRLAEAPGSDTETLRRIAVASVAASGASVFERAKGLARMGELMFRARGGGRDGRQDPLVRARSVLQREYGSTLEEVRQESERVVACAIEAAMRRRSIP